MELRINQQFGQIGLDIRHPAFGMEISHPRTGLEISPPQLQINQEQPRIEIDQTQCFADMGRRSPREFSRLMAQQAFTTGFHGIARVVMEGDLLASIEKGIEIADIVLMNSQHRDEFDVAAVPEHPPVIDFIVEDLHIGIIPGDVAVSLASGQIRGQLNWGHVGVNWRIEPSIDIEYIGQRLDVSG